MSEVTQSDLVAAVHAALENVAAEDGYALTSNELTDALDVGKKKVWEMLGQLVDAGVKALKIEGR